MAVIIYTGTPGSGKSYHATAIVHRATKKQVNVVANFVIDLPCEQKERFTYMSTDKMTPATFVEYSKKHHEKDSSGRISREGQTIIMIDEASILFNSREFNRKDRQDWIVFFSQHRKLGFDIILITQMDRSIDRQIRGVIEFNYVHRKITNFGLKGHIIKFLTGGRSFVCIKRWYLVPGKDGIVGKDFFGIKKKIAATYDTFSMFSADEEAESVKLPREEIQYVED
ncbi:MAG: zonular occludens toxin domain-containing protein [Oscillospiraceae bacterium]|nr:zonular occludens toxin domain-containing protein [Oscillospiraceae bacterium]